MVHSMQWFKTCGSATQQHGLVHCNELHLNQYIIPYRWAGLDVFVGESGVLQTVQQQVQSI